MQPLRCDTGRLTRCAGDAKAIADDLDRTVRQAGATLAPTGGHEAWAITAALGRCADGWITELAGTAQAAHGVADRLSGCATGYTTTEQANTDRFTALGKAVLPS